MKNKLKLNQLNESELTKKELSTIKGGGCFWNCVGGTQKRVVTKVKIHYPDELK